MSTTISFYQHLLEKFSTYSTDELVSLNNATVENNAWGTSASTFRTAIISAFARKGIDLSHIISREDGFTSVKSVSVRLEENALIPLTD